MAVDNGCTEQINITLDNEMVEQVDSFTFLGSYKIAFVDCSRDIQIRIGLAKQKKLELKNICRTFILH